MSYVLDALRKSEQERQMAAGQSASVLYPLMVESRRAAPLKPLLLGGAALALVAAVLAAWLWRPSSATGGAIDKLPPPPTRAPSLAVAPLPTPLPAPAAEPVRNAAPPVPSREKPATAKADVSRILPALTVERHPPAAAAAVKPEPAEQDAKADKEPGEARDLPAALQKELPSLVISGYIRDGEAGSMAMINDRLVREGEEIAPGLRLEKILADGAQFSYKGHRFRR